MTEKPCKWAENPSGAVWECMTHDTCVHKHADTNPDGSVNIFECMLGNPEHAFKEIKRLQRLIQSYQETINKLITVTNKQWIPVKERLPAIYEDVLVAFKPKNGRQSVRDGFFYFVRGQYMFDDYFERFTLDDIQAWQPLPDPPTEEK